MPDRDSSAAKSELLQYAETCDLTPGQRVRSRLHPELTGRIECLEWNAPGVLSAIPYNVSWDNPGHAYDALGWFALWQTDGGIEACDE